MLFTSVPFVATSSKIASFSIELNHGRRDRTASCDLTDLARYKEVFDQFVCHDSKDNGRM
jgi:hypothetical protein